MTKPHTITLPLTLTIQVSTDARIEGSAALAVTATPTEVKPPAPKKSGRPTLAVVESHEGKVGTNGQAKPAEPPKTRAKGPGARTALACLSEEERQDLVESTLPVHLLADRFGVHPSVMSAFRLSLGARPRRPGHGGAEPAATAGEKSAPGRCLTEAERAEVLGSGETSRELAERLGVPFKRIREVRRRHHRACGIHVPSGGRRELTAEQLRYVQTSADSPELLAARFAVPLYRIIAVRQGAKLPAPARPRWTPPAPTGKYRRFTEAEKAAILASPAGSTQLAREMGVKRAAVQNLRNRHHRKHGIALKPTSPFALTPQQIALVRNSGEVAEKLAKRLGCSVRQVNEARAAARKPAVQSKTEESSPTSLVGIR